MVVKLRNKKPIVFTSTVTIVTVSGQLTKAKHLADASTKLEHGMKGRVLT